MKNCEITLGGRVFTIRPLLVGQVEEISALNAGLLETAVTPQERTRVVWRVRREVISSALVADYPEMTPDGLAASQALGNELTDAHNAILEYAGLIPKDAKPEGASDEPGEAAAGTK